MNEKKFMYQKVYEDLCQKITVGFYAVGDVLPWDEQLCEQYSTSKITITKALKMLAEDGYVRRIPGKGTFVCEKTEEEIEKKDDRKLIGVVLEHVSSPFGLEMMYHLDRIASLYGYQLLIRFSYGDRDTETKELQFLLSLGVQGLILMPCHSRYYNQEILRLFLEGFPMVLVDKKLKGIQVPSVRTDNEEAIAVLVREMKKAGYKKIALISTDDAESDSARERRDGYIKEMENQNLRMAGMCIVPAGFWEEEFLENQPDSRVVNEIRKFLEKNKNEIDAMIIGEYSLVGGALRAMELENISVENIAITCIDEDYMAAHGAEFMHVKQDEKGIAEKALEILLAKMNGESPENEDVLIPGVLCEGRRGI